ncbi:hypothetical protein L0665_00080 [Methanogenium marinum]|uniref:Uncharacterized protein n=1 Tax=Methanogenium marinum TaxID=348610 RepID=A0A9Q4KTN7_9EURY|nr:hypothetical protein [Methanogenium marinum]MDE4907026.1 hypothetical protein [Methanogenium marinum]
MRGEHPPTNGGGDVGGMAAALQQHGGTFRHDKIGAFQPNGRDLRENRETLLQENRIWRQCGTTQLPDVSNAGAGPGVCAQGFSANQIASGAIQAEKFEQSNILARYDGGSFRHLLHSAVHAANKGITGGSTHGTSVRHHSPA